MKKFTINDRRSKLVLVIAGFVALGSLFLSSTLLVPGSSFLSGLMQPAIAEEKGRPDDKGKPDDKGRPKFQLEEATIADIHRAIQTRQITVTDLVHMYLDRIKAYNGVCVNEPEGILGPVSTIPNAGQLNALSTLNLRPDAREAWGFDERKARSMTDPVDNDPNMPDALEVAATLDEHFAKTGKLVGPMHGVVFSIKDMLDTFDMRSTSGADAFYENDRPPDDATLVKRLREAGAIILANAVGAAMIVRRGTWENARVLMMVALIYGVAVLVMLLYDLIQGVANPFFWFYVAVDAVFLVPVAYVYWLYERAR